MITIAGLNRSRAMELAIVDTVLAPPTARYVPSLAILSPPPVTPVLQAVIQAAADVMSPTQGVVARLRLDLRHTTALWACEDDEDIVRG